MKNIVTNRTRQQLIFLAGQLPLVMVQTHEKHIMTKAELEEMGYVGAEELEDGRFMYNAPVQVAMNHFRSLRRAFQREGIAGCEKYIEQINGL